MHVAKKHLAPFEPDRDHASLCNVKARRWQGGKLVKVDVAIVSVDKFKTLPFSEACGRCLLSLHAREGTPVVSEGERDMAAVMKPCQQDGCRVTYWKDVVRRGYRNAEGHQVALDEKDAQLALASAELLCKVFHR